jgi:hypothetical protein
LGDSAPSSSSARKHLILGGLQRRAAIAFLRFALQEMPRQINLIVTPS